MNLNLKRPGVGGWRSGRVFTRPGSPEAGPKERHPRGALAPRRGWLEVRACFHTPGIPRFGNWNLKFEIELECLARVGRGPPVGMGGQPHLAQDVTGDLFSKKWPSDAMLLTCETTERNVPIVIRVERSRGSPTPSALPPYSQYGRCLLVDLTLRGDLMRMFGMVTAWRRIS
jgi:hypothetical protein